jgi:putative acetyltransferase
VKIREALPADGDAIRAIVSETLAEFGFPLESNGVDADLDDIHAAYQRRGGSFRVLVDDSDAVVGCGGLYPMDEQTAELRKMYFRPAVRGRGHGRELLVDLVATARANHFDRIVLETASNLTAAIRLYESFGFAETKGPKHSCRCDRTFMLKLR